MLTVFISIKKVSLIFTLFFLGYYFSPIKNHLLFAQTVSFTWLVMTHITRIAAIRFDEKVKFFSNKYVNYSLLIVISLQLILLYTKLGNFFNVVPLPLVWLFILSLAVLIGVFLSKVITVFISFLLKTKYFREEENY